MGNAVRTRKKSAHGTMLAFDLGQRTSEEQPSSGDFFSVLLAFAYFRLLPPHKHAPHYANFGEFGGFFSVSVLFSLRHLLRAEHIQSVNSFGNAIVYYVFV